MGQSGSELLLYGLVIAAFVLFNYLSQWLARKAREQQEAAADEGPRPAGDEEIPEDVRGRPPAEPARQVPAVIVSESGAPPPEAAPAPRAHAAAALLRTPQDLRHAIVVMTVLGTCRALDPPSGPAR